MCYINLLLTYLTLLKHITKTAMVFAESTSTTTRNQEMLDYYQSKSFDCKEIYARLHAKPKTVVLLLTGAGHDFVEWLRPLLYLFGSRVASKQKKSAPWRTMWLHSYMPRMNTVVTVRMFIRRNVNAKAAFIRAWPHLKTLKDEKDDCILNDLNCVGLGINVLSLTNPVAVV